MRFVSRLLAWMLALALLLLLALAAGLWLAIQNQALLPAATLVSHEDIARARALIRHNDPRSALPGITRALVLSQRDLELLLGQAAPRLADVRSRVRLQPGLALVQASLPLPGLPGPQWLNVQAVLRESPGLPTVQRLRVGRLPVPGWLAEAALPRLLAALGWQARGALAQQVVSRVGFRSQQLVLAYAWPDNPGMALSQSLLSAEERARLQVYADRLDALTAELSGGAALSASRLLAPMFTLAAQRSTDAASAERENRAALVALAFGAYGPGLAPVLGTPRPAGRPLRSTLAGRLDTAQHFLISAALAAERGGPLADAIGLYKEVSDSRGGSGFSFNDLAADRAGSRLGLQAVRQPQQLQARLAAGVTEAELLPDIRDLPESLSEAEFKRRYGGVDAPAYRRLMANIEGRLDRLPLLAR